MRILSDEGKNKKAFFAFFAFLLLRYVLVTPQTILGLGNESAFNAEALAYWLLLIIFSILSALVLTKMLSKINSDLFIYPCFLLIVDPIFNFTIRSYISLIVYSLACVFYLLLINVKTEKLAVLVLPIFIFMTTLFSYEFAFSIAPLLIFVLCLVIMNAETKTFIKRSGAAFAVITSLLAVIGASLNKFVFSDDNFSEIYNRYISLFSYKNVNSNESVFKLFLSALPSIIFGCLILSNVSKISEKSRNKKNMKNRDNSYAIYSGINILIILCIIGMIFCNSDSFSTIGIIVPVVIITLLYFENDSVITALTSIDCYFKSHFALCLGFVILIEAICSNFTYNFSAGKKILDYINEII